MSRWETIVENYRSTGINLGEHPMALLRGQLGDGAVRSRALARIEDGVTVEVAGLVVARQRPPTAKGITFMLLEDEQGTVNLVVPSQVYERHRAVVRTAPLVHVRGRLERREGVINVIVAELDALERRDPPRAELRDLDRGVHAQAGVSAAPRSRGDELARRRRARELAVAELRAVVPPGHSFGRRGG